jgi:hypothetical protein
VSPGGRGAHPPRDWDLFLPKYFPDSHHLSKHIKCAKLHIIVDESHKIKRKKENFAIPKNSKKSPKNPEKIPKKSHPDRSRPETAVFRFIPSQSRSKSKCPSRRALVLWSKY